MVAPHCRVPFSLSSSFHFGLAAKARSGAPDRHPDRPTIPNSIFPFLFSVFLFLGACAAPGEPVTRRAPVPAPITNLAAEQSGNGAVLTFTLPRYTMEHRLLKHAPEVEIYRGFSSNAPPSPPATGPTVAASVASGETSVTTESGSARAVPGLSLVVTIPSALVSHYQQDGEIRYTDPWTPEILKQHEGEYAIYVVRAAESRKKSSPDSNIVNVVVYPAPDPIPDLKAQLVRGAIELSWTAPQQTPVGSAPPIKSYEIYRSEVPSNATAEKAATPARVVPIPGGKEATGQPEKIATTETTSYEDAQVVVGAIYRYSVRSVVEHSGQLVKSGDSNVVTITMSDVFPPSSPAGVVVVPVAAQNGNPARIDLSWNVSPEADVMGYNVYRSEQEGTPVRRLNSQLLPTPVFSDMSAVAGQRYLYRVTAVDRSGNESEPSTAVSGELPAESQPKQ